jgi:hypothetical protein
MSMTNRTMNRPPRTFGLSLAILVSVLLYSVLPLMQGGAVLLLEWRLRQAEAELETGGTPMDAFDVGGDFTGLPDALVAFQIVSGVFFLLIAFLAWRGRPRRIRWVMLAAVVALTVINIASSLSALNAQIDLNAGLDSGADAAASLVITRLLFTILVPLYVIWYMNRAPARAFYRGSYADESTVNAAR